MTSESRQWEVGERVLVSSVEKAGEVTINLGGGRYYVRCDDGEVIACGVEVIAPEDGSEGTSNER